MKAHQASLLLDDYPLIVLPQLAVLIGLNEAILLQKIHYWLTKSDNEKGGRKYVYKTTAEWVEEFPFWSGATIKRTGARLKDLGLIDVEKQSNTSWNRTNWYTVNYEQLGRIGSKCADALDQIDPLLRVKLTQSNGANCAVPSDQSDPITITTKTTTKTPAKKTPAAPRRSSLPTDFQISDRVAAWAKEKGFERFLPGHLEKFLSSVKASGRRYVDWDEALMNCIRDDWGDVRRKALREEANGPAGGEWWTSAEAMMAKAKVLNVSTRGLDNVALRREINAALERQKAHA